VRFTVSQQEFPARALLLLIWVGFFALFRGSPTSCWRSRSTPSNVGSSGADLKVVAIGATVRDVMTTSVVAVRQDAACLLERDC